MTENESSVLIGSAVIMFVLLVPIMYYVLALLKKRERLNYADLEA
jgi:hypothetical protein